MANRPDSDTFASTEETQSEINTPPPIAKRYRGKYLELLYKSLDTDHPDLWVPLDSLQVDHPHRALVPSLPYKTRSDRLVRGKQP